MIFQKGKKKSTKSIPPITNKQLADLPYADNFELPREEEKLRAVYEHEQAGGDFDIRKAFSSKGMRSKTITTVANFPAYYDLVDLVEEQYGGGSYAIHPAGGASVLKTYILDGPPRFRPEKPQREKTAAQKLKEQFEEQALSYALDRLEDEAEQRVGDLLSLATATREFQLA